MVMSHRIIVTFCSVVLLCLSNACSSSEVSDEVKRRMLMWLSSGSNQNKGLVELSIMHNQGILIDLPKKKEIFDILLIRSRHEYFLFDSITFLSKFPCDMTIVKQCRCTLVSKNPSRRSLLASLAYLRQYDNQLFSDYIKKNNYVSLDDVLKDMLPGDKDVVRCRDKYIETTLEGLLNQKDAIMDNVREYTFDQSNSKYIELVKEASEYLPSFVNRHRERYMRPSIPLVLLYLLIESASFSSFDILLENYVNMRDFRSAITLACCTGSLQVETLFSVSRKHKLTDVFLESLFTNIAGVFWGKVKNQSFEEKLLFYKSNYEDILIKSRQRAKPIQG